ncbi:endonuclease/exonuclease/phosphatase family protein [Dysgonomonas sp. 520]|uniref:endonuclease/exonuclease/phosphatase family protein n=1 Tax=Dysgonomonas sp. 520 TaxID=2302931 RepID=UPI001C88D0F7|nr:endonuclease/exonuclease/phosphatase family protein [Dysgonomonas sp. 520]
MRARTKQIFALIRQYATIIVFSINLIFLVLMLSSYLVWIIPPSKLVIFAYIGLGFPVFLVVNIVFIVFWFILFKWKLAVVGIVSLILCWNPIYTYIPVNFRTKSVPDNSIKFLTYNIRGFAHQWRGTAVRNNVVDYINESDADIVCIQEFTYFGAIGDKMDEIFKATFPKYPYYSYVNFRNSNNVIYGVVCLSRYPILRTTKIPILANGNGGALLTLNIKSKTVSLFINHLQSNRLTGEDKELYKKFLKDANMQELDIVTNSLTTKLGTAYKERAGQVDIIADMIANEKSDATIVCGDFNDPPVSYSYKKIKGNMVDAFRSTGSGMGITFNERLFWFRIDYIFHTRNITSYNCTVDKVNYSDHYPLWTYLRFNDEDK